ncbi:uncharacterized protein LACBIDRAFT_329316 [Laccaria bicolor S238N-H82]|uniref:Predicted protein n=1 Tax=Laccaria bicolor (strain S238N-H82 / ATCC MYA-4686) TaxID=486041 RepID=B0DHN2_LACBS|nr:uncharacterized protein LACBIDRAFT_329316 [Laccaria bicolor S238N-H82]EDR05758.1 predicted protein [Laccaria bicolor S238N-H82]|eukprot:XP_001883434.1 predicted protein [Laccaria bicolor S238N-H82]
MAAYQYTTSQNVFWSNTIHRPSLHLATPLATRPLASGCCHSKRPNSRPAHFQASGTQACSPSPLDPSPREEHTHVETLIFDHMLWQLMGPWYAAPGERALLRLDPTVRTGGPPSSNHAHRRRPENYEEEDKLGTEDEDAWASSSTFRMDSSSSFPTAASTSWQFTLGINWKWAKGLKRRGKAGKEEGGTKQDWGTQVDTTVYPPGRCCWEREENDVGVREEEKHFAGLSQAAEDVRNRPTSFAGLSSIVAPVGSPKLHTIFTPKFVVHLVTPSDANLCHPKKGTPSRAPVSCRPRGGRDDDDITTPPSSNPQTSAYFTEWRPLALSPRHDLLWYGSEAKDRFIRLRKWELILSHPLTQSPSTHLRPTTPPAPRSTAQPPSFQRMYETALPPSLE